MGAVGRISPDDARGVRRFVAVQRALTERHPLAVPPHEPDLGKRLSPKSALNEDCEHVMFVAGDDAIAACAAFVNRRYQRFHGEEVGFIGYLAVRDDAWKEAQAMLEAAETWLAERGVTRVIAPYNGNFLAGFGLLTDEFDAAPRFPLQWHSPRCGDLLDAAGYARRYPLWSYRVRFDSEAYRHASSRALDHPNCVVRPSDKRRWEEELELFRALYEATFVREWGFHPHTRIEFREAFGPFKPVIDPRQVLFATVDGEPAGFCAGIPDYNPLLRALHGRMGRVGRVRFALGARRVRDAGLLFVGVLEAHRGRHIGQTLAATLYRRYEELGLDGAEYYLVDDDNIASRRLAGSLGGEGRILYHCFDKRLA